MEDRGGEHPLGWCECRGDEGARRRVRWHRDAAWATPTPEQERGARSYSGRVPMRVHSDAEIENIHGDPGIWAMLDFELHYISARPRATSNMLLGELTVHDSMADKPIASTGGAHYNAYFSWAA